MSSDSVQLSINGKTIIIYNNRKPDVYPDSEIYDPDNPESGKVFPSLLSVIIKSDGSLWYVAERDETVYRVTLKPCGIIETDESSNVRVISYGNDKFCLYQDERTDPHKLVVDAKLLFYGNNLQEYALYRTASDGKEEIVSMYLDSADKFHSNRIPMASISDTYPAYKYPTNCHTTHELVEGEPIIMRVFNNLGNLAAEITLFVRNAVWLNDLSSHTNPIVKLDAECLQMRGDDFFIYEKQDPSHLNIRPYLIYADGTKVFVPIDKVQCFMYGLDDFIPAYPGYSQTLVFKYFLSHRETAMGHTTKNEKRFMVCSKELVVLGNQNTFSVKVSTIPVFDSATLSWKLRFFAYSDHRDAVYDITDLVQIDDFYTFNGSSTHWGREQHVVINYDLQSIFNTDDALPGSQAIWITVWDPSVYERYTFRDSSTDSHIYGVDGSVTRRPVIHYDSTIEQYFIPTSIFGNWEAVVESFFHLARPPFDKRTETKAPTPTHFTIRDAYSGQMLIGGPIPSSEYGQAWPTIVGTSKLVGQVIIVEFLEEVNGDFHLLYGVPVDVKDSPTGYNTATNNIYP